VQHSALSAVLKKIPVFLVMNAYAGLLGAAFFGAKAFKLGNNRS